MADGINGRLDETVGLCYPARERDGGQEDSTEACKSSDSSCNFMLYCE